MTASEILRKMADIIDSKQTGGEGTEITNRPEQIDIEAPSNTNDIEGDAQVNTKSMVAPLQQKLEIMKRLAGMDSAAEGCSECGCDPCACNGEQMPPAPEGEDANWHQDEPGVIQVHGTMDAEGAQQLADQLAAMKKNAGLTASLADEDEPWEV